MPGGRVVAHRDKVDQGAQRRCELARLLALDDRGAEQLHLVAIVGDDVRMQHDRRQRLVLAQLGFGDRQRFLARLDRGRDLGDGGAGGQRIDQSADLCFQFVNARFGRAQARGQLAAMLGAAIVIALHDGAHDFRCQQLLLQAAQDALLELGRANAAAVAAGARFAASDAAPAILGDDRVGSAALAASHQAGKDMALTLLAVERHAGIGIAPRLHGRPGRCIDNAQLLGRFFDAIGGVGDTRDALSRARVLLHLHPAIDDAAVIGGVAEDPVLPAARAGDGVGAPFCTAWRRHALAVELVGDRLGA